MNSDTSFDGQVSTYQSGAFAEVREESQTAHRYLVATCEFKPGDIICSFSPAEVFTEPDRLTIQIGHNRHITLLPHILTFTNHSCAPNIFFDTSEMRLICLERIYPGDELTFLYPSTELEMAQPFFCHCGSDVCVGEIQGASRIAPEVLSRYRLNHFIRRALIEESSPPNLR